MISEKFFNRGESRKVEKTPDKFAGLLQSAEGFAKRFIAKIDNEFIDVQTSAKYDPETKEKFKTLRWTAENALVSLQAVGQLGAADSREKQEDLVREIINSLGATKDY